MLPLRVMSHLTLYRRRSVLRPKAAVMNRFSCTKGPSSHNQTLAQQQYAMSESVSAQKVTGRTSITAVTTIK